MQTGGDHSPVEGYLWENRRREVRVTLSFCRAIYAVVALATGAAFIGMIEPTDAAWDGLAAILTANTAVYVPTLGSYLFAASWVQRP